jgi:hypothetical protein
MKTKQTKSKAKAKVKDTLVEFLLDRSGSMSTTKDETISGFNGYIDVLKKNEKTGASMRFGLTQFDSIGIDRLHDGVPLDKVMKLDNDTFVPRANTPLRDAMAKTIHAAMKKADGRKVLFVTLTDGQENASSEYTQPMLTELIKECEKKHKWTFAYIGVGPEGWAAAQVVAKGTRSFSNVTHVDPKDTKRAYRAMGQATTAYACSIGSNTSCVEKIWKGTDLDEEE